MKKWISPQGLGRLLEDIYPASDFQIRAWCEAGLIPPPFALRTITPKAQGHWRIAVHGLDRILSELMGLSPQGRATLKAKLESQ